MTYFSFITYNKYVALKEYEKCVTEKEKYDWKMIEETRPTKQRAEFQASADLRKRFELEETFGDPNYWDQEYILKQENFDWLVGWEHIKFMIEEKVTGNKSDCKIMNLGCGNSILCEEMYDQGYT